MSFLSYSSNFQSVVDIFMRDPTRYLPFTQLLAASMDGESELSKDEREIIAIYVSKLNNCHYCVGSHKAVLVALGLNPETIAAAEAGSVSDARMAPVLAFATKLTRDPGSVVEADVDAMRDAGWSEQAVEDVIGVASVFAFLNRLVDGFGVKGSTEGFSQSGEMIAKYGYGPVVQMVNGKATA